MSTSTLAKWRSIETQDEILNKDLLKKDEKLEGAFNASMEFGTAGIRGVMGAGTNKMNIFTVAAAADAYAKYLIENVKDAKKKGVVIGHDNRRNSALFSETVAKVLLNNGVKAYLFENNELQPTPLVSYVIRKMKLAGGAIITASHNPKEYNGFKVYNNLGGQLMPSETKKVQELMKDIDPLKVNRESSKAILIVKQELIDQYVSDVLKVRKSDVKLNDFKIAFTAQHGTSATLGPRLLREMGAEVVVVDKQQTPDPDFSFTKSPNPEEAKSYKKVFVLARKEKADMIVATDPDADRIGIAVRHEKRYKFLDGNQTAAVYLDYLLGKLKRERKLPKDGYIVTSHVSGDLPSKIAAKYGVKTIQVHVGFKNIAEAIENTKGTYLFGFEESYGSLINPDLARDKDSFQAMVAYAEMASFYKTQGTNAYKALKDLYHQYGIHRNAQINRKMDTTSMQNLLKRLLNLKKQQIGEKRVVEVQDFLNEANLVKVIFDDGSWFSIRPSGTEPKVKIYIQTVGTKKQELMDVVYFEKFIQNWINDNTEEFLNKKFKWTTFFKYMAFIGLTVGIFLIVFFTVYSGSQSATVKDGKSMHIYSLAEAIFNSQKSRWIWFSVWGWTILSNFINAWGLKRSLQMQGEKASIFDLVVSTIMGDIVGFVTPFAVGGDAIGYWYMRRRGIKRGALISAYMSNTLMYQLKFTLQTVILISIGWGLYEKIFGYGDPEAHAALIWFIIGTSWTIFSTTMIFVILMSRRFQEFLVRNTVKLLEWTRFYMVTDPGELSSGYMYEFKMVRVGMKKLWTKWWFVLEMLFYKLAPLFFEPTYIIFAATGFIASDIPAGTYMSQIVVGDIVGTANSMSLTPGGSGTGEWLWIVTRKILFDNSHQMKVLAVQGVDARQMASGFDFMAKIIYGWPFHVFTGTMVVLFIALENRRTVIDKVNKNHSLNNRKQRGQTRFRFFVYGILAAMAILIAMLHFFVWFK